MKKVSPIMIVSWLIIIIGGIYLLVLLSKDKTVYEDNQIDESQNNLIIEEVNEVSGMEDGGQDPFVSPEDFTPEPMTSEEKAELDLPEALNVMVMARNEEGEIMTYEIIYEDEVAVPETEQIIAE